MTEKKVKVDKLEYLYEGKNKQGNAVKGSVLEVNLALAKAKLRKQGINVSKIKRKPKPLFQTKKKILPGDICIFFRQQATMMKAGVALIESFNIVANGSDNESMRELINNVRDSVESGSGLAESMAKHPNEFDELTCNLVQAGENSGTLEAMLDRIATYKEKTEALKAKVKKALMYPIAVMVVAAVVTCILLIWVVPQFESLFANFDAELPVFTQFVINMSRGLQDNWYLFLGALFGIGFTYKTLNKKSEKFRQIQDRVVLRLPIIGDILEKSIWARYARTLSTTFAAGVPLLDSLESVAGAVGNSVYRNAVRSIIDEISTGQQLQMAMRNVNLFPSMMLQMVAIGEEAGSLDDMLTKIADFLEEDVDNKVEGLSSLLEPIIIVFLGVVVGGLIVAMYLPIFKMGSVVG